MSKMYGSYSDDDLNDWERLPLNAMVLTSSGFGAWLYRRDENKRKQENTDVLNKIKADIEQYQADCGLSCSDDVNCRTCDRITFDTILGIIDKYRKGNKE